MTHIFPVQGNNLTNACNRINNVTIPISQKLHEHTASHAHLPTSHQIRIGRVTVKQLPWRYEFGKENYSIDCKLSITNHPFKLSKFQYTRVTSIFSCTTTLLVIIHYSALHDIGIIKLPHCPCGISTRCLNWNFCY